LQFEACEELGISDDCQWLGFADDLVIRSHDARNAEEAFHQLQSSCAFIGLRINAPKTECIAINVTSPVVTEATAKKERIQVVWDDDSYEGWLIDWSAHPHFISQATYDLLDFGQFNGSPPTHLIIYDDGEMTPVLLKRGGWLVDIDGDKY